MNKLFWYHSKWRNAKYFYISLSIIPNGDFYMKNKTFLGVLLSGLLFLSGFPAFAGTLSFAPLNVGQVYNDWGFGNGWFYGIFGVEYNGRPTIAILTSEMQMYELPKGTYNVTPVANMSGGYLLTDGVYNNRDQLAKASVVLKASAAYYLPNAYTTASLIDAAARQEMVMSILQSPFDFHQGNLFYTTQRNMLDEYNVVQAMDTSSVDIPGTMFLVPGYQVGIDGLQYSDLLVLNPDLFGATSSSSSTTTSTSTTSSTTTTTKKEHHKHKREK
jgi:hypothetical protein